MATDHHDYRGKEPVQVIGSDMLKRYTGSLPVRTGIFMVPRRLKPAGDKASVCLPGPVTLTRLSPNERAPER